MIIKKPVFESTDKNSPKNLQDRYDWYMMWKDTDIDFTKDCIFIDEATSISICCRIAALIDLQQHSE